MSPPRSTRLADLDVAAEIPVLLDVADRRAEEHRGQHAARSRRVVGLHSRGPRRGRTVRRRTRRAVRRVSSRSSGMPPARRASASERSRRRSSRSRDARAHDAVDVGAVEVDEVDSTAPVAARRRGCCWRSDRGGARRGRADRGPRGRPRRSRCARASPRAELAEASGEGLRACHLARHDGAAIPAPRQSVDARREHLGAGTPRWMTASVTRELADRPRRPAEVAIVDEVADGAAAPIPAQHAALVVAERDRPDRAAAPARERHAGDDRGRRVERAPRGARAASPSRSVSEPHGVRQMWKPSGTPLCRSARRAAMPWRSHAWARAQHLAVGLDDRQHDAGNAGAASHASSRRAIAASGRPTKSARADRRRAARTYGGEALQSVDRVGDVRRAAVVARGPAERVGACGVGRPSPSPGAACQATPVSDRSRPRKMRARARRGASTPAPRARRERRQRGGELG